MELERPRFVQRYAMWRELRQTSLRRKMVTAWLVALVRGAGRERSPSVSSVLRISGGHVLFPLYNKKASGGRH